MFCLNFISFLFLFSLALSLPLDQATSQDIGCITGPSSLYFGTQSWTRSGLDCQRWDSITPHIPAYAPLDGTNHNFCRNPDDDINGVWCYTTDLNTRREYCDVPKCRDDSKIIWADVRNNSARILSIGADSAEIRKRLTQRELDPIVLAEETADDHSHSEFVGITGSYGEQTIFFADSIANCIVVKNLNIEMESRHLTGLAAGVRSMTYDWIRQNLYWTDDIMKVIMVADATLSYYAPVFSLTGEGSLHAVTLHAAKELLFFTVRIGRETTIYVSDLSGADSKPLFTRPRLHDVTSISIDCTDNRIYFTDYLGFGSLVYSSNLNGTDVRRHLYRRATKFAGISAYDDYIFMTDATGRFDDNGDKVHALWLKSKSNWRSYEFSFKGDPRGMKVLSAKEEDFGNMDFHPEDCLSLPPCDHMCLPRKGARRECVCALGYTKVGDTGCQIEFLSDKFLLVADENQGKIFQLPFNNSGDVSLLPLDNLDTISDMTMAVDAMSGSVYIGGGNEEIKKFPLSGEESVSYFMPVGSLVGSIALDPLTGNVYYSDVISQSIYVKNRAGVITREIMTTNNMFTSDIKSVALDLKNKKVYWTNTNAFEGAGQVLRMNMDGSEQEVVLGDLQWPHGLAIDYARGSIFVSEAKQFVVHEISLQSQDIVHNFSFAISTQRHDFIEIKDITYYGNSIYFLNNHQILKADLSSGELKEFCPPHFYKPISLTAYDHEKLQQHIDSFSNPCSSLECETMCLMTSSESAICA